MLSGRMSSWDSSICCIGRTAVDRELVDTGGNLLLEAADALHEELVEDRARDREELHPLEQRGSLVLSLVKDSLDEREPGQLPIEVVLGRVEIDIGRWTLLFLSGNAGAGCPLVVEGELMGGSR